MLGQLNPRLLAIIMRTLILIFLTIHATTATLAHLQKLKDNAAMKLQVLQDKTASTIKHITDNIDLEKIQKYDVLNILPKIETTGKLLEQKVPEYAEKIKGYLKILKSLEKKDLLLAFDGSPVPWAAMRRMDIVDYQPNYYKEFNDSQ